MRTSATTTGTDLVFFLVLDEERLMLLSFIVLCLMYVNQTPVRGYRLATARTAPAISNSCSLHTRRRGWLMCTRFPFSGQPNQTQ